MTQTIDITQPLSLDTSELYTGHMDEAKVKATQGLRTWVLSYEDKYCCCQFCVSSNKSLGWAPDMAPSFTNSGDQPVIGGKLTTLGPYILGVPKICFHRNKPLFQIWVWVSCPQALSQHPYLEDYLIYSIQTRKKIGNGPKFTGGINHMLYYSKIISLT